MGRKKNSHSRGKSSGAPPRQPTPWRRTRTAPGGGRQNGAHPRERGCEGWRRGRSDHHGDSGFPLLGGMPFRKWAPARGACGCLSALLEKEAKGAGRHGAQAEINDDSDRGRSQSFLKVRVLSGSLRRNERASPARCEGGWTVVIAMILTMDRDFWPGSNCWARSSMRETPPRLVPGAADDRPLSASAVVPLCPLSLLG